jgi:hypothetical protein
VLAWIYNDFIPRIPPGIRLVTVEIRSSKGRGKVALTLPHHTRASAIVTIAEYQRILQTEVTQ